MSDIAIRVENLSKLYRIGQFVGYRTLRESLMNAFSAPFRRFRSTEPSAMSYEPSADTIWALKDVSFEVKQGEAIGIIGRNGAGKTTLLKILTRITEPTEGSAEIHGRVGSLLEVGTGFHAELTGRENIYLNGAVLGMKRAEIQRKFDEIVDFSGVEKFIDTPLKRYSSGMQVRLAFAVAAHLEPEILLVDEVLAVGDAEFQKRCLGKMGDVAKEGRTVLFVSHNMQAILRLCHRVVLLDRGKVAMDDSAERVIDYYLGSGSGMGILSEARWDRAEAPGDDVVRLRAIRVRDKAGRTVDTIEIREPVSIEVEYWQLRAGMKPSVGILLYNNQGICLFASYDFNNTEWRNQSRSLGLVRSTCWIPGNFLAEGRFTAELHLNTFFLNEVHHISGHDHFVSFQVVDQSEGDGVRGPVSVAVGWQGVLRPMLKWTVDVLPSEQATNRK